MNRLNSFFFFVDLGDYVVRNLPKYVYDQNRSGGREIDIFNAHDTVSRAYAGFSQRNYYNSLLAFNTAIKADSDNGLLYLARAQVNIATNDYRAAYDDLVSGMELIPEWADVDLNIAEFYSNPHDLQKHMRELEVWVEKYPRDFKAHFVLGYFYYFQQDYISAKSELIYALSWNGEHQQSHDLMDRILAREAEAEIADAELTEVSPSE